MFDIEQFNDANWRKKTVAERKELLQALEDYYAAKQGRKPCKLIFEEMRSSKIGEYHGQDNTIHINEKYLDVDEQKYCKYLLAEAVIHEGRHAHQNWCIDRVVDAARKGLTQSEWDKLENELGANRSEITQWYQNREFYIQSDVDKETEYLKYRFQSRERDARDYTQQEMVQLFKGIADMEFFEDYLDRREKQRGRQIAAAEAIWGVNYKEFIDNEVYEGYLEVDGKKTGYFHFEQFNDDIWANKTLSSKINVLQSLENVYAYKQDRPALVITVGDLKDGVLYARDGDKIVINRQALVNEGEFDRLNIIYGIMYEGRIEYQKQAIKNFDDTMDLGKVQKWKENHYGDNYISLEKDPVLHRLQASGRDAHTHVQDELGDNFYAGSGVSSYAKFRMELEKKEQELVGIATKKWGDQYESVVDQKMHQAFLIERERLEGKFDFEQFNINNWRNKTPLERLSALRGLEEHFAAKQGRPVSGVVGVIGRKINLDSIKGSIYMEGRYLESKDSLDMFTAIAEVIGQGRGDYQKFALAYPGVESDLGNLQKWRENLYKGNFVRPGQDPLKYMLQPAIRDQQSYVQQQLDEIFDRIPSLEGYKEYKDKRDKEHRDAIKSAIERWGEDYVSRVDKEFHDGYFVENSKILFGTDNWKEKTVMEKIPALMELEHHYAAEQGRPACNFVLGDNNPNNPAAFYNKDTNEIIVNIYHAKSDDVCDKFKMIEAVLCAGRTAYQEYAVNHDGVEKDLVTLQKWKENDTFINRDTDVLKSVFQAKSRDANDYALAQMDKMFSNDLGVHNYQEYRESRDKENKDYINSAKERWGENFHEKIDKEIRNEHIARNEGSSIHNNEPPYLAKDKIKSMLEEHIGSRSELGKNVNPRNSRNQKDNEVNQR